MLPQADGRGSEITVRNRPVFAVLIPEINTRQVAWVIPDQISLIGPSGQRTEDVVPIMNVKDANAVSADPPAFAGQKIEQKSGRVLWVADSCGTTCESFFPRLFGRLAQSRMYGLVINAEDLEREPALQFLHRHDSAAFRIVLVLLGNIRERGAR